MKPLLVGLTGGVGSGKTLVAKVFGENGIPVFNADSEAKNLMIQNPTIRNNLIALLGEKTYLPDGNLNKDFIGEKIFADTRLRESMNSIVHPAVIQSFREWTCKQSSPYVLHEAAILFETGLYSHFDYNILVVAPVDLRLKRIMERDGITKDLALSKIKAQWEDDKKAELADFLIRNDETIGVIEQVLEIHKKISVKQSE